LDTGSLKLQNAATKRRRDTHTEIIKRKPLGRKNHPLTTAGKK
jgi:hypothetical protein